MLLHGLALGSVFCVDVEAQDGSADVAFYTTTTGVMMMAAAAPAMDFAQPQSAKRTSSSIGDAPRVRKDFSETFLFETFPVGWEYSFTQTNDSLRNFSTWFIESWTKDIKEQHESSLNLERM